MAYIDAAEQALIQNRSVLLPPYNSDATRASEVYPIETLLPQNVHDAMLSHYDSIVEGLSSIRNVFSEQKMIRIEAIESFHDYFQSLTISQLVANSMQRVFPASLGAYIEEKHVRSTIRSRMALVILLHILLRFICQFAKKKSALRDDVHTNLADAPVDLVRYLIRNHTMIIPGNSRKKQLLKLEKIGMYEQFHFFHLFLLLLILVMIHNCILFKIRTRTYIYTISHIHIYQSISEQISASIYHRITMNHVYI